MRTRAQNQHIKLTLKRISRRSFSIFFNPLKSGRVSLLASTKVSAPLATAKDLDMVVVRVVDICNRSFKVRVVVSKRNRRVLSTFCVMGSGYYCWLGKVLDKVRNANSQ